MYLILILKSVIYIRYNAYIHIYILLSGKSEDRQFYIRTKRKSFNSDPYLFDVLKRLRLIPIFLFLFYVLRYFLDFRDVKSLCNWIYIMFIRLELCQHILPLSNSPNIFFTIGDIFNFGLYPFIEFTQSPMRDLLIETVLYGLYTSYNLNTYELFSYLNYGKSFLLSLLKNSNMLLQVIIKDFKLIRTNLSNIINNLNLFFERKIISPLAESKGLSFSHYMDNSNSISYRGVVENLNSSIPKRSTFSSELLESSSAKSKRPRITEAELNIDNQNVKPYNGNKILLKNTEQCTNNNARPNNSEIPYTNDDLLKDRQSFKDKKIKLGCNQADEMHDKWLDRKAKAKKIKRDTPYLKRLFKCTWIVNQFNSLRYGSGGVSPYLFPGLSTNKVQNSIRIIEMQELLGDSLRTPDDG